MVNRYGLAGDEGRGVVRDQPNYTAQLHSQSSTSRGGIGTLDYNPTQGGYSASS